MLDACYSLYSTTYLHIYFYRYSSIVGMVPIRDVASRIYIYIYIYMYIYIYIRDANSHAYCTISYISCYSRRFDAYYNLKRYISFVYIYTMVSFVHSSKLYRMYNHIVSTIYRDRLALQIRLRS